MPASPNSDPATIQHHLDMKSTGGQAKSTPDKSLIEATAKSLKRPIIIYNSNGKISMLPYRITEEGSRKEMPVFVQFDGWHYQAIPGKVSVELPKMKKTVSKPKKSKVYEDKPGSRSNSAQRRDNSAGRDAKKAVFK